MEPSSQIFNRTRLRKHRDRASKHFSQHDFLLREMSARACDRLLDITRDFPAALILGSHQGIVAETLKGRSGIETLVESDFSQAMLGGEKLKLVADEELLPFAANSFDLVVSVGSLHWVNDLPGTLIQINRMLKPDGLLIAILPGGETLKELRQSFEQAELALSGGISPRVSPFIDVQSGGALLQRAGFTLPVADSELVEVQYEHPLKLLKDLRGMGESNTLYASKKTFTPCSLVMTMADHYFKNFSYEDKVTASFELVTLTGWKAHDSQQKPSRRGSGQVNLGEILS